MFSLYRGICNSDTLVAFDLFTPVFVEEHDIDKELKIEIQLCN